MRILDSYQVSQGVDKVFFFPLFGFVDKYLEGAAAMSVNCVRHGLISVTVPPELIFIAGTHWRQAQDRQMSPLARRLDP